MLCSLHLSLSSIFLFKFAFKKNINKLSLIENLLKNSLIEIFLLLKQEHVNLTFFLSLQNLIKGNLLQLVQK